MQRGKPAALIGSRNRLEIAVNGGNAGKHFGVKTGDVVLAERGKANR